MKTLIAALLMTFALASHAATPKQKTSTCDDLQEQANQECVEEICEEWKQEDENAECDFSDGGEIILQECSGDKFWVLLEAYNKGKSQGKQLTCE